MKTAIIYSSSDSYSKCTGVSIFSLLNNNLNIIDELDIYILDNSISNSNKNLINEVGLSFNKKINYLDITSEINSRAKSLNLKKSRGSYSTYARLFICEWFKSYEKAIFIDSDTLINNSIYELIKLNLNDFYIAAVPDITVYGKNADFEDENILNESYFNMGIIVFNVKLWNGMNIDSLISKTINEYPREFRIVDQSILNLALNGKIYKLDLKYNFYSSLHDINFKYLNNFYKKKLFNKLEFEQAQKNPFIIHFIGHSFDRPWFRICVSKYKKTYREYYYNSPYKNISLDKNTFPKNKILNIYDKITLLISAVGLKRLSHLFRYSLGQKVKNIIKLNR